jgi:hypothetical protein
MNAHIKSLIDFDARHEMFGEATRFVDYEMIPGDIVEFGVYTGRSLILLSHYHEAFKRTIHGQLAPDRQVIGLDSFRGLPENPHPRWVAGMFRANHSYHPTIPLGDAVTPEHVIEFFAACDLPTPLIISGDYQDVPDKFNSVTHRVALAHIDCDLYDPTLQALNMIKDKIQDGAIILFDDWFNFRGSRTEGEQKAFAEFLESTPQFEAIPYHPYVTFGNSFILKLR